MGLSKLEQETIINFNAEEDTATIWTADPVWIRKLDKMVENNPEEFKCTRYEKIDGVVVQKKYEMPKKLITVRSKTLKREMTEEQRRASAERLRQMRFKKNS